MTLDAFRLRDRFSAIRFGGLREVGRPNL